MIFGRHIYKVKTVCHMQEWLFSLTALWVISNEQILFVKLCALNNFYIFKELNGVKYKYIFESQCVVRFKNDCSLGLTF